MRATLFFPSGTQRVLNEQELFDLWVTRPQLMGLPVLCADIVQAARVLGFATTQTLAQCGHFVAFAGEQMRSDVPYEPLAFNTVAQAVLRALGVFSSQPCPLGPVLVVENVAVPVAQQTGQSYALAF